MAISPVWEPETVPIIIELENTPLPPETKRNKRSNRTCNPVIFMWKKTITKQCYIQSFIFDSDSCTAQHDLMDYEVMGLHSQRAAHNGNLRPKLVPLSSTVFTIVPP